MIKIPIEDVIKKIVAQSGMSETEVNKKIDAKMKAFDEIVSRDGAAFMVASENGQTAKKDATPVGSQADKPGLVKARKSKQFSKR